MAELRIECAECGTPFHGHEDRESCRACGGGLRIVPELGDLRYDSLGEAWRARPPGVWRYRELLPPDAASPVTLGEGGTALLSIFVPGDRVTVLVKNEGQNPTGSFKDRGLTVGVTHARSLQRSRVICASTGNTAASLAAYAARASLECIVLVPAGGVAQGKLAQATFEGAHVISLRGRFDDAMRLVPAAAERLDAYVLNSINPFRIEGQKTAAFEVYEQLGNRVPDWLACPVGNGGNLAAYWKGFQELKAMGATTQLPHLLGVQAEHAAPIADAILANRSEVDPVKNPETVASAIRIGNPANWRKTMRAIRESGGTALKLPDAAIVETQRWLARTQGIFVEPASAASVAGVQRLLQESFFTKDATVVCVATGHGLKDPEAALRGRADGPVVEPTIDAIEKAVVRGGGS